MNNSVQPSVHTGYRAFMAMAVLVPVPVVALGVQWWQARSPSGTASAPTGPATVSGVSPRNLGATA
jgi:hypothetical protein